MAKRVNKKTTRAKAPPKKNATPSTPKSGANTKPKKTIKKKPQKTVAKDKVVAKPTSTRVKPLRNKKSLLKFIKVKAEGNHDKFVEMGKKVQKREVVWSYYAMEGNIGYHYYLILKQ